MISSIQEVEQQKANAHIRDDKTDLLRSFILVSRGSECSPRQLLGIETVRTPLGVVLSLRKGIREVWMAG